MARHRIIIPLYNHPIDVYYSVDEFLYPENYPAGSQAVTWEANSDHGTTIVFKKFSINTAAHEAVHAIYSMLNYVGVPVNHENQETVAYPLGYLVEQIILGHKKWEEKRNAK